MTLRHCDGCQTVRTDGRLMFFMRTDGRLVFFTVTGTDHLAPQIVPTAEVGELLAEGWTVTMHDHKLRRTKFHPFCGFECWRDYLRVVVTGTSDITGDEAECPNCGRQHDDT